MRSTYKEYDLYCPACLKEFTDLFWDYEVPHCPDCKEEACLSNRRKPNHFGTAPGVVGDDIPGGMEIKHGLVNDDGSPKRFYSKTDIKREANRKGLKILGDTPGIPYKV